MFSIFDKSVHTRNMNVFLITGARMGEGGERPKLTYFPIMMKILIRLHFHQNCVLINKYEIIMSKRNY